MPPYAVSYSENVRISLRELCARAAQVGLGDEALRAVRIIDRELHLDPLGFGDPWFELRDANLQIMVRVFWPLSVVYGVHQVRPVVFPRTFSPYPDDAF